MKIPRLTNLPTFMLITILLFGCNSSTTTLQGKVYRSIPTPETPDKGAHIALYDSNVPIENLSSSDPVYETTTDSKGQYEFDNVAEGAYQILLTLPGSDSALSVCTKVPVPGSGWVFYSLSYDAVGNPDKLAYRTDNNFNIASGDKYKKDFGWICK